MSRTKQKRIWKRLIGLLGEHKARGFLKRAGLLILASNVRTKRNEIDIIALDKNVLVGIEVKTRVNPWIAPETVPDERKLSRVYEGLKRYSRNNYYFPERVRIDIVGIEIKRTKLFPTFQVIWHQGDLQRLSKD